MGVLNTTPRTWVTSEVVTAAELNAEVRDAFTTLQSAWTAYTPTLTNITLSNGALTAYYQRVGKTITVRFRFAAGSTTTYSAGNLGVSLPVAAHADYLAATDDWAVGAAVVNASGSARMGATAFISSAGVLNFIVDNLTASPVVTNLVPATFGTTSKFSCTVTYEAA